MRIAIRHEFVFPVAPDVAHAVQHLLLTPQDTEGQTVIEWTIRMPGIETAGKFLDAFGNTAHLVAQRRPEEALFISVTGLVETRDSNGMVGRPDGDPVPALFKRVTPATRPNGNLVNRLKAQQKAGASRIEMLHWLMNRLHEAQGGGEEGEDAPEIVAEDHAHVFVAAARGMGVPARFVTGYVLTPEEATPRLHVWAEALDEHLGWIGFDPLVNLCPTEAYVRLATGLDAETAAPVRRVPDRPAARDERVIVTQAIEPNQQQQ